MAITRLEMNYYKNIERIAVALETIATQPAQARVQDMQKVTQLLHGTSTGRSHQNYTYGNRQDLFERSELEQSIYEKSQTVKGGDFPAWYESLTEAEREAYGRVRDQLSR